MQQVRSTVVAHRILSPLGNNIGLHAVAHTHVALANTAIVDDQSLEWATGILNLEDAHRAGEVDPVADLPTALGIEWGSVEYYQGRLWCADTVNLFAIHDQSHDFTAAANALVACEFGWPNAVKYCREYLYILTLRKGSGGTTALLLHLHGLLKTRDIDDKVVLSRHLLCEFQREAM